MADVRLIIDPPSPGPWNMAVDEVLLMDAVDNGNASLRFYQWSEPTLSLGYFQPFADRKQHFASRNCAIVRRQSGGGAILHDHELTYSFVLPPGDPLTRDAPHLYNAVHAAFIAALTKAPQNASTPPSLKCRGNQTSVETPDEPFLCFQRQSPGDVVLCRQPTQPSPVFRHGKSSAALNGAIAEQSSSMAACCSKNRRRHPNSTV